MPSVPLPTFAINLSGQSLDEASFLDQCKALGINGFITIPARPEYTMPKPFVPNDAIIIERTITDASFVKIQTDTLNTPTLE